MLTQLLAAAAVTMASVTASPAAPGEPVRMLQALLRVDTTNPPGGEGEAARLMASWLAAEGIPSEVIESTPGRFNLLARLDGDDTLPPLLLLNHLDVVTADPAAWKHPPFAGVIADGALWGRGALDMKGLGVMELVAFLELKRQGVKLKRDVIFLAVADEEAGGGAGARWMLEHRPDDVRCSEVLNEGGAGFITKTGHELMGIQTAERGTLWVRVTATGAPGHGSQHRPDGATRKLVRALARLEATPPALEVIPATRRMLEVLATTETGVSSLALSALTHSWLLPFVGPRVIAAEPALGPVLGNTWNTTVLDAGSKVNVMPGSAAAEIDIRVLPGRTTADTLATLKATLADESLTYEVLHAREPSQTTARGALYQALEAAVAAEYPQAKVLPVMTPGGGTDSGFFREAGVAAYGLMPILTSQAQLESMHGDNEHITLEQLERGTRVVVDAVRRAAGTP